MPDVDLNTPLEFFLDRRKELPLLAINGHPAASILYETLPAEVEEYLRRRVEEEGLSPIDDLVEIEVPFYIEARVTRDGEVIPTAITLANHRLPLDWYYDLPREVRNWYEEQLLERTY